jgi:enterochelin esterase-like enzyme
MAKAHTVFMAILLSTVAVEPAIAADTACVPPNASIPAGANTSDPKAPFFIDTTGMDLKTTPPTRDPHNPNYPEATELPDGQLPSINSDGNFIIGATHKPSPETVAQADVPHGTVHTFTMNSADSIIYRPGMIRDDMPGCGNSAVNSASTAPGDKSDLLVPASHAGSWSREVDVYVPPDYVPGTTMPFIVFGDGGSHSFFKEQRFFNVLDNLIHAHKLPPMVAIGIAAGGQDAQGSERGREYDAVSGTYAEWVEQEVLPRVEQNTHVQLTKDPDGRATMGFSSSAAAAFTMAWFRPDLYHRVLGYSPTMVNQQWPHDTALPGGAWQYHSAWAGPVKQNLTVSLNTVTPASASPGAPLIPNSPRQPIRYWFEAGDRDLFYPLGPLADGMHDWTASNEDMARVLAAKGYHYQFVFARNAGHVDDATEAQTMAEALEWVWKDYPAPVR